MKTFILSFLFILISVFAISQVTPQEEVKVLIAGDIIDTAGRAIAKYPVELIVEREVIEVGSFSRSVVKRKVFETETDNKGSFYFTWTLDDYYNRFYINYYVKDKFDSVQFLRPVEPKVDASKSVGKSKNFEDKLILSYHPDWFNLLKMIDEHGKDSDKGIVLRKWGIYEKKTESDIVGITYTFWWYYMKGKAFKFQQEKLVKEFTYRPLTKME